MHNMMILQLSSDFQVVNEHLQATIPLPIHSTHPLLHSSWRTMVSVAAIEWLWKKQIDFWWRYYTTINYAGKQRGVIQMIVLHGRPARKRRRRIPWNDSGSPAVTTKYITVNGLQRDPRIYFKSFNWTDNNGSWYKKPCRWHMRKMAFFQFSRRVASKGTQELSKNVLSFDEIIIIVDPVIGSYLLFGQVINPFTRYFIRMESKEDIVPF